MFRMFLLKTMDTEKKTMPLLWLNIHKHPLETNGVIKYHKHMALSF